MKYLKSQIQNALPSKYTMSAPFLLETRSELLSVQTSHLFPTKLLPVNKVNLFKFQVLSLFSLTVNVSTLPCFSFSISQGNLFVLHRIIHFILFKCWNHICSYPIIWNFFSLPGLVKYHELIWKLPVGFLRALGFQLSLPVDLKMSNFNRCSFMSFVAAHGKFAFIAAAASGIHTSSCFTPHTAHKHLLAISALQFIFLPEPSASTCTCNPFLSILAFLLFQQGFSVSFLLGWPPTQNNLFFMSLGLVYRIPIVLGFY